MTIQPVVALPLVFPSDDEVALVDHMLSMLSAYETSNALKVAYYEGEQRVQMLGISIPPSMERIQTVVGWPGTAVDVLEERLDLERWVQTDIDFGLDSVFRSNQLEIRSGMAHLDALIYGTGFITVGADEAGPLVTVESASAATGIWDVRRGQLAAAWVQRADDETAEIVSATLYLPDETVTLERKSGFDSWVVADRDQHNLGRVMVAQLVNRPRSGRMEGRSEITKAVRGYTDAAVRTLLGMEVHREFYQAPQRYVLGASEDAFVDADGNNVPGWQTIMGRVLGLGRDEDGELPQVGQFPQSQPGPYLEQIRGLAQLLSAETAIPATYLGFATDQAASADAIRAMESRLEKRARRRQMVFGEGWIEVARLALLARDGEVPVGFDEAVSVKWTNPATPTPSAQADAGMKLVSAGILTPDSPVTYDRVGLSPQEQRQVESDKRRAGTSALIDRLGQVQAGASSGQVAAEDAAALKSKADAMGVLIRAGVDPDDAAARVGLTGLHFTGATPVALRLPESQAERLEDR